MKIQITATISMNGYLALAYEKAHRWSFSRKYALPLLRDNANMELHKHTSLISLINDRRNGDKGIYLVQASSENTDLIKGLLLYDLADEIILYVLPEDKNEGIRFTDYVPFSDWTSHEEHRFNDGTYYRLYRRRIQP